MLDDTQARWIRKFSLPSRGTLRSMRTLLLLAALSANALAQQQTPPAAQPAAIPPAAPAASSVPPQTATPPAPPPAASPSNSAPAMTPSDAYRYAMQPFNDARGAPDDLTTADKWALGIGIQRANQQCEILKIQKLAGEDLLALGRLCVLGQDFEPARGALVPYVILPDAKSAELGRLLLTKAFLGLQDLSSAESQIESLLSLFPYDASIHLGIDMVVDKAEASDAVDDLDVIPRLNDQQLPHILDALAHGGAVPPSNGDAVGPALLVRDALRCADALRRNGKPDDADKILARIKADVAAPSILNSPDDAPIEAALTRYAL